MLTRRVASLPFLRHGRVLWRHAAGSSLAQYDVHRHFSHFSTVVGVDRLASSRLAVPVAPLTRLDLVVGKRFFSPPSREPLNTTVPPSLRDHPVILQLEQLVQQRNCVELLDLVASMYAAFAQQFPHVRPPLRLRGRIEESSGEFDAELTKVVEQEAVFQLNLMGKPSLALKIYDNRNQWLKEVGHHQPISDEDQAENEKCGDSMPTIPTTHLRGYYSGLIQAASARKSTRLVREIYSDAVENGVYPTSGMNQEYLRALMYGGGHEEVLPFYQNLLDEDGALSIKVFRAMILFAAHKKDFSLQLEVADEVSFKGFRLEQKDFLTIMRTAMDFNAKHSDGEDVNLEVKHEQLASVLDLFDRMLDDDEMQPTLDEIYLCVLDACVMLEEYDRVPQLLELYDANVPSKDPAMASRINELAVQAFLAMHEHSKAFELIEEYIERTHPSMDTKEAATLDRMMQHAMAYTCDRGDVTTLLQVVHYFSELLAQDVLAASLSKSMPQIMSFLGDSMPDDDELLAFMTSSDGSVLFGSDHQRTQAILRFCVQSNRLDLGLKALQKQSKGIDAKACVGVQYQRKCIEQGRFDLIVTSFKYFRLCDDNASVEMLCLMIAACDQLQKFQQIRSVVDQFRDQHHAVYRKVPREILAMVTRADKALRAQSPGVEMPTVAASSETPLTTTTTTNNNNNTKDNKDKPKKKKNFHRKKGRRQGH